MAGENGVALTIVGGLAGWRWFGRIESGANASKLGGAAGVCQESEVTDAAKALRQGVEQEATDELVGVERHRLGLAVGAIILPSEADLAVLANALAAEAKQSGNLATAAKSVDATVKTSDFVGRDGQIPDLGQLGQMAPQVFSLGDGQVSNAINTGRNGIVIKLTGKQEPDAAQIAKNLPSAREQMGDQRRERRLLPSGSPENRVHLHGRQ